MSDQAQTGTNHEGRDARGRFLKGNRGGPGNPFARQVALLRCALLEVATYEDMLDVATALLLKAKQGDSASIKLLYQYVYGKPTEGVEPDRLDQEEWKLHRESTAMLQDASGMMAAPDFDLMLQVVRSNREVHTREYGQELIAHVDKGLEQKRKAEERKAKRRAKREQQKAAEAAKAAEEQAKASPSRNGASGDATDKSTQSFAHCCSQAEPGNEGNGGEVESSKQSFVHRRSQAEPGNNGGEAEASQESGANRHCRAQPGNECHGDATPVTVAGSPLPKGSNGGAFSPSATGPNGETMPPVPPEVAEFFADLAEELRDEGRLPG